MNFERARIAYHAYGQTTDFKNFRGEPMPAFDDLPDPIKRAWVAAAEAVAHHVAANEVQP